MTNPINNEKAGAGLHPDAGSENHMAAGLAHKAIAIVPDATDNPAQMELDFTAKIPEGAYDGVEQAVEGMESNWRAWALHELEVLARTGLEFTASDLVKVVGAPDHPNRIGAAFLTARKAGLIEPTGSIVPSTTPSRHGAIVRVWRGRTAA